ncbi:MAG TPA: response regulator transcription factor [Saprospiraceae bacterium]|nr:response regulator transcription factor [Saprospiraceae bacterium]HMQ82628.1 response regulator transcription factor [Saprospiraceae bacterium]
MITVAIVDNKRDLREGLQHLFNSSEGFQCVGAFSSGHAALAGLLICQPDVILMEAELPDMSGSDCIRLLKLQQAEIETIIFTDLLDDEHVFAAFKAGATGYLSKSAFIFPSRLLNAIREVNIGGAPMEPKIARKLVGMLKNEHTIEMENLLSDREAEVLGLLCQGLNHRIMAKKLFVSPNTVRFHLKNIYKKLNVNSRHEAVIKANKVSLV